MTDMIDNSKKYKELREKYQLKKYKKTGISMNLFQFKLSML